MIVGGTVRIGSRAKGKDAEEKGGQPCNYAQVEKAFYGERFQVHSITTVIYRSDRLRIMKMREDVNGIIGGYRKEKEPQS